MTRIGDTYAAAAAAAQDAPANRPVPDQVTDRILDLLDLARGTLRQVQYEGSHTVRQNPAPVYGSPWQTPDVPSDLLAEVATVQAALDALYRKAHRVNALPLPTLEV